MKAKDRGRGRRRHARAILLPFRRPTPRAIGGTEIVFRCGNRLIRAAFDRYLTAECRWVERPCFEDVLHPEESFTVEFRDVASGVICPIASSDEVSRSASSGPRPN
jgi:hypothetical protein